MTKAEQEAIDEQLADLFEMAENGEITEEEAVERGAFLLFGPDDVEYWVD